MYFIFLKALLRCEEYFDFMKLQSLYMQLCTYRLYQKAACKQRDVASNSFRGVLYKPTISCLYNNINEREHDLARLPKNTNAALK